MDIVAVQARLQAMGHRPRQVDRATGKAPPRRVARGNHGDPRLSNTSRNPSGLG